MKFTTCFYKWKCYAKNFQDTEKSFTVLFSNKYALDFWKCHRKWLVKQARKPRSYASLKLCPLTHSLTGVRCRATSVAKNLIFEPIGCWCFCIWKWLQTISISEQLALLKAWIWHQQSFAFLKNAISNLSWHHSGCAWIWNQLSCMLLKNANLNHCWHHSGCTGPLWGQITTSIVRVVLR